MIDWDYEQSRCWFPLAVEAKSPGVVPSPRGRALSESKDLFRTERDALLARVRELEQARDWQPIETAPKDGTVIIGALVSDGRVWRVHDMKHNGLAFYTQNGGSLPRMTHWIHVPAALEARDAAPDIRPRRDGE